MAKRLLEYDPVQRKRVWHDYDHLTKKTYIIEQRDVSPILNFTKAMQNMPEYRQAGYKQDMMHFARVPNEVIVEWQQKYNLSPFRNEDLPKIEKLLQSEYKHLRTVSRI